VIYVIGLDVGGANLKAVKLLVSGDEVKLLETIREYFPLWIHGKVGLEKKLRELKSRLTSGIDSYVVAACMTAELCDIYRVKREGVEHVVRSVCEAFHDARDVKFVTVEMKLVDRDEAVKNYLKVAAANWAASAWFLEKYCSKWGIRNLVFIDIGSTTTTIIPIVGGKVQVLGLTDPEKLQCGELVYTGVLRGNVAALVDKVPYKGYMVRVSFERFALMGDVHLVLSNIAPEDYTTETADGRGKSVREAMERLARVVCADVDMMNEYEIRELARYIYEVQVFKVFEALMQIRSRIASQGMDPNTFTAVTAGIGEFLARVAAVRAGFKEVISIRDLVGHEISSVFPAYAAALMLVHGGA